MECAKFKGWARMGPNLKTQEKYTAEKNFFFKGRYKCTSGVEGNTKILLYKKSSLQDITLMSLYTKNPVWHSGSCL
jgi:hypothetical protein